jgi:hypothetical protein
VLNAEAEGFVDEFTDSAETLERKLGRKLTNQENDALWDSFPNEVEGDIDVEGAFERLYGEKESFEGRDPLSLDTPEGRASYMGERLKDLEAEGEQPPQAVKPSPSMRPTSSAPSTCRPGSQGPRWPGAGRARQRTDAGGGARSAADASGVALPHPSDDERCAQPALGWPGPRRHGDVRRERPGACRRRGRGRRRRARWR